MRTWSVIMQILIMIHAVLNCLSCGSENRHNHHVFNFVHVGLLPALIQFVQIRIGIRAVPDHNSCGSGIFVYVASFLKQLFLCFFSHDF